jgi:hypothetical protein
MQQINSSDEFSASEFLDTLPNTPGAAMFARRSFSFAEKPKKNQKRVKKAKKTRKRRKTIEKDQL